MAKQMGTSREHPFRSQGLAPPSFDSAGSASTLLKAAGSPFGHPLLERRLIVRPDRDAFGIHGVSEEVTSFCVVVVVVVVVVVIVVDVDFGGAEASTDGVSGVAGSVSVTEVASDSGDGQD